MTKYREILRLLSNKLKTDEIVQACRVSKKTVIKVKKRAAELGISWPLGNDMTDEKLEAIMFPRVSAPVSTKRMPDFEYIRKELLRNGVNKKLLWTEYLEQCRREGAEALMYSQFCYYIQQDEQKRHATMHIPRKPGQQAEVDWAGDTAYIIDRDSGEAIKAYIFVGAMSYSTYAFAEAFPDMKQGSWIKANVHMLEYFGGVPRMIIPDNTSTAVNHNGIRKEREINQSYQEFAEHYNTAIIPARVRRPRDKPVAEGSVSRISTWIVAALRNEQFFSFESLNREIRKKLDEYNSRPFTAKEGNRGELFREEELPLLAPLPATPYELASWKKAKVQFNYHITLDFMHYSCPYVLIGKDVDVRVTDSSVEIFFGQERVASHRRLYGRKGQYSTTPDHMPEKHRNFQEWNGDRFRQWARKIGTNTYRVTETILASKPVEEQSYLTCRSLLKLADTYSDAMLEEACGKACQFSQRPSYNSVKNILQAMKRKDAKDSLEISATSESKSKNRFGITRGADYYGGGAGHAE